MKPFLIVTFFFLASCSAVKSPSGIVDLGDTAWNLTAIGQEAVDFGDRAFIKFDESSSRLSGKAVCNSFFSGYEKNGQNISFSAIGATKMYCEEVMGHEDKILANLQKVSRYKVESDTLYLYSGDSVVLTFKR